MFGSYRHMTGLNMGQNAKQEAPYPLAMARSTEVNPEPLIDLAELKAFFKALDDAPAERVDYANRFMLKYTDDTLRVWP